MHTLPTVHRLAVGWPATLGARRLISLSCWLTIISLCLGNLRAAPPAQPDYFSRAWTTANGLPDNKVTAVIQTRDGYLWLGTYGGLVRFDGVRFTVFSSANTPQLASDRVTSLFEDSRGVLWIGHERGDLTACQDLKFTAQTTRVTGVRRKISAIGEDADGDIWMLDEEGTLVRARDGAIRALPNHDGLALMAQAGRRELWVASGGQLATLNHGQLVSLMAPAGTINAITGHVQGIGPGRLGGWWIVADGAVRKWNGQAWTEDRGRISPAAKITAIVEMASGAVALGTVDNGLLLLLPQAAVLQFSHAEGFPHDWIRCLGQDQEGTLWAGAGNAGLVAFRPRKVATLNPPDGWQGRTTLSVTAAPDGTIWAGTEGAGLYRYFNQVWSHFDTSQGLSNLFVWSVSLDARGRVWAGTWGGGMFVQTGDHFSVPAGLENVQDPMPAILQAPDGVTWIGTASGLIRYANGRVTKYGEPEGLRVPDVRAIVQAQDGTIWFGMQGGGLGRLQNGVLKQFLQSNGLPSEYVQCLHLDARGTLWIGTYGSGLVRFQNGQFAKITTAEGLADNFICSIAEDAGGNFWIGSHNGIFRVARKSLDDCASGQSAGISCLTYGLGDGLTSLECAGGLQPASCQLADGRICFPTSRGLVLVNPGDSKVNGQSPPVVIEEMVAAGRILAKSPASPATLTIPPGQPRFEFHYTGLSFIAPEKMQFAYRLAGWEKDWVPAGGKRVAEYSYIPPGQYTFQVRACNSDGIWNPAGAALTLVVRPNFWQTWWFHGLATVAGVALVAGTVLLVTRRRMKRKLEDIERQQALERERTRIAKDIHDHLGANLTRISLLSQSAQGELENPLEAAEQLNRIYDTSRELTRAMDEIVWAVNPQHDTLDSLASYLGNFAQEYLVPIHIRCRLDVPLHLPHWPISAEVRHNVFLAFKEALHNVVKHAGATEVLIRLTPATDGFALRVCDNGRGFDPAAAAPARPGRGNGLKNMRQRLEQNGGHCRIQSTLAGTEVEFFLAVNPALRPRSPTGAP